MDNKKLGIIYMIIASISFSTMAVMVKLSGGRIPLFQQVFFRNFIMLLFSIYELNKGAISIRVEKKNWLVLFLRCSLGFLGVISVFYANNHMNLSDAQILQKLNPFFVIIFAAILLGEELDLRKILTIMAGFIGATIIINPLGNFNLFPSFVGVLSAFFGAMAYLMIRRMKGRVNGMLIIFYFSLFSFIVSLPLMVKDYVKPNLKEWIFLILIGVFAALGQYFITKSYLNARASDVTLFDYSGVMVAPIYGYLIFNEALSLRSLVGMAIIIVAGYFASKEKVK